MVLRTRAEAMEAVQTAQNTCLRRENTMDDGLLEIYLQTQGEQKNLVPAPKSVMNAVLGSN